MEQKVIRLLWSHQFTLEVILRTPEKYELLGNFVNKVEAFF